MKHALLGVVALFGVGAQSPVEQGTAEDVSVIVCNGNRAGTVWRVSGDRYVTADHVGLDYACTLEGRPIRNVQRDPVADIAFFSTAHSVGHEHPINCGGFVAGEHYRTIGYADGVQLHTSALVGTGEFWRGHWDDEPDVPRVFAVLLGIGFPGMSGGPILNEAGESVGILNGGSIGITFARPLSETALCNGGI